MTTPQRADEAARAIEAIDEAYAKAMGSESLLDAMHAGEVLCYQTRENWPTARAHIRTLEEQVARLLDVETGHRIAIADYAAEVERLRGALREAEWGTEVCCPVCWNIKAHGHVVGCRLAAALAISGAAKGASNE